MDPRVIEHESLAEKELPVAAEITTARELITKAEGLFEQVSREDQEDMVDLIETISNCIAAKDIQGLDAPIVELQDIIYYLES